MCILGSDIKTAHHIAWLCNVFGTVWSSRGEPEPSVRVYEFPVTAHSLGTVAWKTCNSRIYLLCRQWQATASRKHGWLRHCWCVNRLRVHVRHGTEHNTEYVTFNTHALCFLHDECGQLSLNTLLGATFLREEPAATNTGCGYQNAWHRTMREAKRNLRKAIY